MHTFLAGVLGGAVVVGDAAAVGDACGLVASLSRSCHCFEWSGWRRAVRLWRREMAYGVQWRMIEASVGFRICGVAGD